MRTMTYIPTRSYCPTMAGALRTMTLTHAVNALVHLVNGIYHGWGLEDDKFHG